MGRLLNDSFPKKNKNIKNNIKNNYKKISKEIHYGYKNFRNKYKKIDNQLKKENNIVGYGAGQMVPSVAYHLNKKLDYLSFLLMTILIEQIKNIHL